MEFNLNYKGFEEYLLKKGIKNDNARYVFRFPNGYGASVCCGPNSYGGWKGLYELAVIQFTDSNPEDWRVTYWTPITDDVLGYLSDEKVRETLERIKNLKGCKSRYSKRG